MTSFREPALNVPRVVALLIAAFAIVQIVRGFLGENADIEVLLRFSFIPARYDAASEYAGDFLGGEGAKVWTFVTYAFLHGGWTHLVVNSVWMLAFGSALAWRFGAPRFLVFSALAAAAGAGTHLALHFGEPTPVVGASAAISAHMSAALRFVFEAGGPLGAFRGRGPAAFSAPAEPFGESIRRRQVMVFVGAWFALNLLFGLGGAAIMGEDGSIAWEAHIGGFVAGLLLFALLDPVGTRRGPRHPEGAWDEPLRAEPADRHDGRNGAAERPAGDA